MGSPATTVTHTMRSFVLSVLVTYVAARPDGPGGHHHHGHHGDHGHHPPHGEAHHHQHGSHQVGGVISVEPVHHAVHHHQEPVHVVHSVHSHPSSNAVADLLSSNPKFSTLLTAVQAADLMETLRQPGQLTVFAPTNTAFDKVRRETTRQIKT